MITYKKEPILNGRYNDNIPYAIAMASQYKKPNIPNPQINLTHLVPPTYKSYDTKDS
ncbi:hypothetical protein ACFFU9_16160 [Mariniflexile ostreae]|uniref:Uncharacterized protein n=1 Tax=Mariniflexile ostreae TaxID=1520892 RepID=A0ABV5FFR8_9FLAO